MTPILIEFLIGLYFVVADAPTLFSKPRTWQGIIRFVLGVVLVVLSFLGISLIH